MTIDDNALLRDIAKGDQRAFRQLMERHARPMLALAQRTTGSADDADEIVQETFLKVWTLAAGWDPEGKARFSTWLHRVVVNACLDRRRRAPMAPLDSIEEPPDPGPHAAETIGARQTSAAVKQALDSLPPRQKAALWLTYFGEATAQEAAQILEMTQSAVEALLVRGRRKLKLALAKNGITSPGDLL